MGRHKRMDAAHRDSTLVPVAGDPEAGLESKIEAKLEARLDSKPGAQVQPWWPEVEPERRALYDELAAFRPRLVVKDLGALVSVAAAMVVQDPAKTRETDRKRVTLLCQLLAHDRDIHGSIDLRRALRRVHVERYTRVVTGSDKPGTLAAYSSHFNRFGRLLHPGDYPPRSEPISRPRVRPPYSEQEVKALYRHRLTVSETVARRLVVVLDLATGAGARAEEMNTLTGSSIRGVPGADGTEVVYVDLPSRRTGELRSVPVFNAVKGSRLRARAQEVGADGYLLPGPRRNAVNSVRTAAARSGVNFDLHAVRLRHTWIVELAQRPIPTAVLLKLADLGDSHTVFELAKYMRPFDEVEMATVFATLFKEMAA